MTIYCKNFRINRLHLHYFTLVEIKLAKTSTISSIFSVAHCVSKG